jgi:nucleoside-diphosphate-sugar epimerase
LKGGDFTSYGRLSAMTTVLLTGASGYIGKHITLQLLNQGYKVRASVRKLSKSVIDFITGPFLTLWEGDKYFIPFVFDSKKKLFHGVMPYHEGKPTSWDYQFGS